MKMKIRIFDLKEPKDSVFTYSLIQMTGCHPNPCKNHATCINYDSGEFYGCLCQTGYSGNFCEIAPGKKMF